MGRPTTSPKLRRDGPDAYVGTLDPWPGKPKAERPTYRVERDGDEWVELRRHYTGRPEPRAWYPTLAAFRRRLADVNVARWVNGGAKRSNGRGGGDDEARAVLAWARRQPGVAPCDGVRRYHVAGLGSGQVHDGCCDTTLGRTLPEGTTLLDLYERWDAQQ